jgi:hypothetical protein
MESSSKELIVGFEGVAQAIMAEQALVEQGFFVRIMPMPAGIRAGCGFCLRFVPEDFDRAAAFLSGRGLAIKEAWEKSENEYRKIMISSADGGTDGQER